jgi:hypothetical protein
LVGTISFQFFFHRMGFRDDILSFGAC